MKIKNKNFTKYKIKNLSFSNKNWNKKNKIRKNPEIQKIQKILKPQKNPKNLSFFDRFSLTHSGGSSVPLGTIINSSRTNPRFGPSFK